jgi:hypothetical protein
VSRQFLTASLYSFVFSLSVVWLFSHGAAHSPAQAKRRHEWWVRPVYSETLGRPVKIDRDPSLYEDVFPGYARPTQPEFWNRYFSYPFDVDTRSENLSAAEDELVPTPWLGCPDLYADQGADLILMGTSEMYRAFHAPSYSRHLGKAKILNCGRSSLLPGPALAMLRRLQSMHRPKAKALLLGYSLWWAYPEEPGKAVLDKEQTEEIESYQEIRESLAARAWNLDGVTLFGKFTWDELFPSAERTKHRDRVMRPVPAVAQGSFYQGERDRNIYLHRSDVDRIGTPGFRPSPYYRVVKDGKPASCGRLELARTELKSLLATARSLAEHVYVYLPPITPLGEENFSPCFRDFAEKTLLTLAGPNVHVRSETWRFYDLDWRDFVYPTANQDIVQTDFNHANYSGSKKVSQVLAAWIAHHWSSEKIAE